MNWRPILATIALGSWLILVGGIIYLGRPHERIQRADSSALSKFAMNRATIVIKVVEPTYEEGDPSLRCGGPDALTIAWVLQSQRMQTRLFSALTPEETAKLLGGRFIQDGKTPFGGIRIAYDLTSSRVTITGRHRDPQVACLLVERLYGSFTGYFYGYYSKDRKEMTDRALKYFDERKTELAEKISSREADLAAAKLSQNQSSVQEFEKLLLIDRDLLRKIENRIAAFVAATTTPPPLPFHVVEARVVSGPFWNRTVTDFTANVVKLEKPRADQ